MEKTTEDKCLEAIRYLLLATFLDSKKANVPSGPEIMRRVATINDALAGTDVLIQINGWKYPLDTVGVVVVNKKGKQI